MYVKTETTSKDIGENPLIVEMYGKDKKIYYRFSKEDKVEQEMLFNLEENTQVNIFHPSKSIQSFEIENPNINPIKEQLDFLVENIGKFKDTYEYCGKEKINEKECIKISFISDDEENTNTKTKIYYYIDINNKAIVKIEFYDINENEEVLYGTELITYSYNTVTDNDILEFDVNNYPDYQV